MSNVDDTWDGEGEFTGTVDDEGLRGEVRSISRDSETEQLGLPAEERLTAGNMYDIVHDIFAWIWNHAWGTALIVFGLWSMFTGNGFWIGLVCIGVGIYFMV